MRGLTFSLIAATAIAGFTTLASAQPQQAGVSAAVRGQVALARASENVVGRQVQSGDPIFLGDAITSGKSSGLQIMLLDETVFTIGPNSEIAIDEFVYDPETSSGKISASVAKGAFRFITGKIARKRPEDMTVRLPTATIGIRGTIVAGVVRTAPGDDPVADDLFQQLKKDLPGAEDARDFVVLLGPGDENNTNDKGGAFVFAPNPPQQAMRGRSAGAQLAQQGGVTSDDSLAIGIVFANAVRVSRTGSAAVGFEDGDPQGPFFVSDFARFFSRVFPETVQGTVSANDPSARQASGASDPNNLSGNTIADSAAEGSRQAGLAQLADSSRDVVCPTCGSGDAAFDFADLRAITTGQAFFSRGATDIGPFSLTSLNIDLFFGQQILQFNAQGITGGGIISPGQLVCNSSCSISYANSAGPAIFTSADNPLTIKTGCENCTLSIAITSATSNSATANVTLEQAGSVGSAALSSN